MPARTWTVNEYDEGRPTDGTANVKDQVTLKIVGARVRDYFSVMGEKRVTETQYDWAKGLPKLVIQDSGGLNLTTSAAYDAQGRITDVAPPAGTGDDAATRVTEYWAADGTGFCKGRPEWADQVCWSGPAGAITGGGSQPDRADRLHHRVRLLRPAHQDHRHGQRPVPHDHQVVRRRGPAAEDHGDRRPRPGGPGVHGGVRPGDGRDHQDHLSDGGHRHQGVRQAPAVVAKTIVTAATDTKPKLRYAAGPMAGRARLLRFVPAWVLDKQIRSMNKLPG